VAENTPVPLNRIERALAFMIAGIGGLSLVAIIAILVATSNGARPSEGPLLFVAVFPALGLPVALVLIIVFAVISVVRRRRIARDGGQ
jgi:hypothetical protein